jgi:hypothetical protein
LFAIFTFKSRRASVAKSLWANRIENSLGHRLVAQIRGSRLPDLSLNAIDIIDRNLYERSCDVRWWATDSAIVDELSLAWKLSIGGA